LPAESSLKLKATSPFRYAIGMFGTSIPINMFKTFALKYYVDMLGLDSGKYALVIMIYTFVDAVDNPVYGFISDRTRTKWGRRRPWMAVSAPLLVLMFIVFYNVPGGVKSNDTALYIYMLLTYILTGTLDSLINANYGALFPELFPDDKVRAKTNAMRQAFQLVAMVISIALTPMITDKIGYGKTSLVYGLIALVVMWYCTFGCKENPIVAETEKPQFWPTLKALFTNPKFWIFGFANAFFAVAGSIIMQAIPLYVKYTLGLEDKMTTYLMACVFVSTIISIGVWSLIAKKVKIIKIWKTALLMFMVSFVPMYFVSGLYAAMGVSVFLGACYGGVLATNDVIGAKIMDEDTEKYGIRREGIYSSAMGFMNRLNGLFVSLALLIARNRYGYISGKEPGPDPGEAAKFLMVICPIAALMIGIGFAMFMKFKNGNNSAKPERIQPEEM